MTLFQRAVRKAKKQGFIITEEYVNTLIDVYYAMKKDVFGRRKIPLRYQKAYYEEIFSLIKENSAVKAYTVCTAEGNPVAGEIVAVHNGKAYGLDTVSFRKFQKFGINNYLQWYIIERLKKNNILLYDLGPAVSPGIEKFKQSLGAKAVATIHAEKHFSSMTKMAKGAYLKAGRLVKKLRYLIPR